MFIGQVTMNKTDSVSALLIPTASLAFLFFSFFFRLLLFILGVMKYLLGARQSLGY